MHTPPIEPGSILCQCYAKLPVLAPSAVAVAKAFVKTGDLQYHAAPAFLSGFEYSADDDPDKLWSLRFFNDYEMGQCASHATATSRRPWLPPRHPPAPAAAPRSDALPRGFHPLSFCAAIKRLTLSLPSPPLPVSIAHFPKTLISWIPTRVLFTMIPELKGGLGKSFS